MKQTKVWLVLGIALISVFAVYSTGVALAQTTKQDDAGVGVTIEKTPLNTPKEELPKETPPTVSGPNISIDQPYPEAPRTQVDKIVERVLDVARGLLSEENAPATNTALAVTGAVTALLVFPSLSGLVITAILQNVPLINFLATVWLPFRRQHNWGVVRDKKTKLPVGGVMTLLHDAKTGKEIQRYRTDRSGRYGFLVEKPGSYYVRVDNPLYFDYYGQMITIKNLDEVVTHDIFLLPNEEEQVRVAAKARKYLDVMHYVNLFNIVVMMVGSIVSVYVFVTTPTILSGIVLFVYAIVWAFKLITVIRYRRFGVVVDGERKVALPGTVVQLTPQKGKDTMPLSTISDSRGRFLFIVRPNKYRMLAAKEGYESLDAVVDQQRVASQIELMPNSGASS